MSSQFTRTSDTGGKSILSGFASNQYVAGTKEFLQSNSIVTVAFPAFSSSAFVIALRLGTSIKLDFLSFSRSNFSKWND